MDDAQSVTDEMYRRVEVLEQRSRQLAALHQVGRTLTQTLNLPDIYRTMFREVVHRLFGAPHLAVALFDQATQTISCGFALVDGEEMDPSQLPRLPLGEGPVSDTIRTQQARIVDLQELGERLKASGRAVQVGDERRPRSAMYAPMVFGGQVLGVMYVQHYQADAFQAIDVALFSILAYLAAMALNNAAA